MKFEDALRSIAAGKSLELEVQQQQQQQHYQSQQQHQFVIVFIGHPEIISNVIKNRNHKRNNESNNDEKENNTSEEKKNMTNNDSNKKRKFFDVHDIRVTNSSTSSSSSSQSRRVRCVFVSPGCFDEEEQNEQGEQEANYFPSLLSAFCASVFSSSSSSSGFAFSVCELSCDDSSSRRIKSTLFETFFDVSLFHQVLSSIDPLLPSLRTSSNEEKDKENLSKNVLEFGKNFADPALNDFFVRCNLSKKVFLDSNNNNNSTTQKRFTNNFEKLVSALVFREDGNSTTTTSMSGDNNRSSSSSLSSILSRKQKRTEEILKRTLSFSRCCCSSQSVSHNNTNNNLEGTITDWIIQRAGNSATSLENSFPSSSLSPSSSKKDFIEVEKELCESLSNLRGESSNNNNSINWNKLLKNATTTSTVLTKNTHHHHNINNRVVFGAPRNFTNTSSSLKNQQQQQQQQNRKSNDDDSSSSPSPSASTRRNWLKIQQQEEEELQSGAGNETDAILKALVEKRESMTLARQAEEWLQQLSAQSVPSPLRGIAMAVPSSWRFWLTPMGIASVIVVFMMLIGIVFLFMS